MKTKRSMILRAGVVLIIVAMSIMAADWGSVTISKDGNYYKVILQNSIYKLDYHTWENTNAGHLEAGGFLYLRTGASYSKIGNVDQTGGSVYWTIIGATLIDDGAAKKTVRMEFKDLGPKQKANRISEVTIYKDSPVYRVKYVRIAMNHSVDWPIPNMDAHYAVNAEPWQKERRWPLMYPELKVHDDVTEFYFSKNWYNDGNASIIYKGRIIWGLYNQASGVGYANVVEADKAIWMKWVRKTGLERYMYSGLDQYNIVVRNGQEDIDRIGRAVADAGGFPGDEVSCEPPPARMPRVMHAVPDDYAGSSTLSAFDLQGRQIRTPDIRALSDFKTCPMVYVLDSGSDGRKVLMLR